MTDLVKSVSRTGSDKPSPDDFQLLPFSSRRDALSLETSLPGFGLTLAPEKVSADLRQQLACLRDAHIDMSKLWKALSPRDEPVLIVGADPDAVMFLGGDSWCVRITDRRGSFTLEQPAELGPPRHHLNDEGRKYLLVSPD